MRQLMILEVSQKQAYIFESTKLRDNVKRLEEICWVTDPEYFKLAAEKSGLVFDKEKNVVYSGGGHTVLEFPDWESAEKFAYGISSRVKREYPELEYFIKTMEYQETGKPGDPGRNLFDLSRELEKKKSVRAASFHQGSFGIEEKDTEIRRAKVEPDKRDEDDKIPMPDAKKYVPGHFIVPYKLEELGVSKGDSSFVAIVHIDGNGMGNRVAALRKASENLPWEEYKQSLKNFSDAIDSDFKTAFRGMLDVIAEQVPELIEKGLKLKERYFPVRKLILAGDDVCFVTEGRIGLEAARIFIEKLSELENAVDHKKYTACAEMLCSNAKRFLVSFGTEGREHKVEDAGTKGCAIDWHIEFGEIIDDLSDMRKKYATADGGTLELRPYLIKAEPEIWNQEKIRRYDAFKRLIGLLQAEKEVYARGKIKELRWALKEGETATEYYLQSSLIDVLNLDVYEDREIKELLKQVGTGRGVDRRAFLEIDGKKHSLYFDAIEMLDTFISLRGKEEQA